MDESHIFTSEEEDVSDKFDPAILENYVKLEDHDKAMEFI